jgi:uncharacterized protein (TIGR00369 family)
MDREALRQLVEEFIPFNRFLGIRIVAVDDARVELELPWRDEFVGDPLKPAIHGGVISALADVAGGIAVWNALGPHQRVSTIDLRVDYLRPGRLESLIAEATTARVGRSVGVADVRVFHGSARGDTVATAKGVYAIKTPRAKG